MTQLEHPDDGLLVGYLDGELTDEQFVQVRNHLATCGACRNRREQYATLSGDLQSIVDATPVPVGKELRQNLASMTTGLKHTRVAHASASLVMRRFGWGMAAAASLALGLLLAPHPQQVVQRPANAAAKTQESGLISINGENFISVPYSNPDLPLNAPRIVEMRVPVSSLASAGIMYEPVSGLADHTVRANVLLGLDGQPRGVHVLSEE
jgi:hypothetical protein